ISSLTTVQRNYLHFLTLSSHKWPHVTVCFRQQQADTTAEKNTIPQNKKAARFLSPLSVEYMII
ncbi:MAG: hypothetical protein II313_03835, partial [Anaerotignum sp.]|nr:hypothetical protein [Anaerotignum sp.]